MLKNPRLELDEMDLRIIQELNKDGRMPIRSLATKIGINQRTASSRLQRIIDSNVIKVVAVPEVFSSMDDLRISMGFSVKPECDIHAVVKRLASYSNIYVIATTSGPYDIMTWAAFSGLEELAVFLKHQIGKISGITGNETLIYLELVKQNAMTYPETEAIQYPLQKKEGKKRYIPDELDMSIIKELLKNGRMPVIEMAKSIGVSRLSTSKRLQRLISEHVIHVIAVAEPGAIGYEIVAMIGIKVLTGKVVKVANKLASFNSVHFVAISLGRYNIILNVHFSNIQELTNFIRVDLGKISDIDEAETSIFLKICKDPWG